MLRDNPSILLHMPPYVRRKCVVRSSNIQGVGRFLVSPEPNYLRGWPEISRVNAAWDNFSSFVEIQAARVISCVTVKLTQVFRDLRPKVLLLGFIKPVVDRIDTAPGAFSSRVCPCPMALSSMASKRVMAGYGLLVFSLAQVVAAASFTVLIRGRCFPETLVNQDMSPPGALGCVPRLQLR
ncbi:hypothetical protein BJ170DRAFT_400031 [Xylariales sp. AK1849]|nr:hypothetical protein BJ170DRAFT_400031 [Xylariales sp. AK1849]